MLKDKTNANILLMFANESILLEIPSYLDAAEVNEVMKDAKVLWQQDNKHNYCVLAVWPDEDNPFESSFYFSIFFGTTERTLVSHDAVGHNMGEMLVKLATQANRYFSN